jgi:tetratricopeptide (TPR) repeat protein
MFVLTAAVLLVLVFPVAARLAADAQPIRPGAPAPSLPPLVGTRTGVIHPLPVFSSTSAQVKLGGASNTAAVRADFLALAQPLLGSPRATALWRIVTRQEPPYLNNQAAFVRAGSGEPAYPFRYPPLSSILNVLPRRLSVREVDELNDLGALLTLAAARFKDYTFLHPGPDPNAAAVGYALLDRGRSTGACAPQENIAFLVAADQVTRDPAYEQELQRAERVCSEDPTPLWLQGQFEAQRAIVSPTASFLGPASGPLASATYRATLPLVTYRRLELAFPRMAGGWAGEADTEMRIGYQTEWYQPFSARQRFVRALALYRRAASLQPGPDTWHGDARALAALGDVHAAVELERRATAQASRPAMFRGWLLEDLERLHEFSLAADQAAALARGHGVVGPGLYPNVPAALVDPLDPVKTQDFGAPFSVGTDELTPVTLDVGPAGGGASAFLSDLAFIPAYRPLPGLGGDSRWCPEWSRRLDRLLAGHPAEAVSNLPATLSDIRGGPCFGWWLAGLAFTGDKRELAAVAELELGDVPAAQQLAKAASNTFGGFNLSQLEDNRQNIWRYAGNLEHADAATTQWMTLLPSDPLAPLRKGEVAFLRGRYEDAILAFQAAVRTARVNTGLWSHDEAQALLDEGAALVREGRRAEALAAFSAADAAAADWLTTFSAKSSDPDARQWPPYISYTAWVQAGDAELAGRDYARATEAYRAASDDQRRLPTYPPPLLDTAVAANNRAIAELKNGDPAIAVTLAASAVASDPADPIFHSTEAWALQRAGRWSSAVAEYRAAVALDPTEYPAYNDLGVLLMQHHRYAAAAAMLRRAVGANTAYAKGWFNLGVALTHMGPLHVFAAQGSLGKATKLDKRLEHHAPSPVFDDVPYVTNLDLSKPLPAHWTFVDSQRHAPIAAAGLAAILLLGLGLARTLLPSGIPGGAERWLSLLDAGSERVRRLRWLHHPLLAVAVTVALFVWPLRTQPTGGWLPVTLFVAGLLVLAAVAIQARVVAMSRTHVRISQEAWPPGLILGTAVTLVGLGWAPLPVARADAEDQEAEEVPDTARAPFANLHWAAPAVLGVLALAQLLLAAWLDIPLTRSLGAAALVMTASLLTPIKPVDGGTIATTTGGAVTILAVAGTATLVLLGVL